MTQLTPFLIFPGSCREALELYASTFDGEIAFAETFADAPVEMPAGHGERIFNAELRAGELVLRASDCPPGDEPALGRNVALLVHFPDGAALEEAFARLAGGGEVIMPLDASPAGAPFGMLVDRFGVQWMLGVGD